jgi:hypothetical protein
MRTLAENFAEIKAGNILLSVANQTIFAAFEEDEKKNLTSLKVDGDRRTYCSSYLNTPEDIGLPIRTDFGNAYIDSPEIPSIISHGNIERMKDPRDS